MSLGISVSLPLVYDKADGPYALLKDHHAVIKQNVRCLFLTDPGGKIMDPGFGVGLKTFLFENPTDLLFEEIKQRALFQVKKYLPFVQIKKMLFSSPDSAENNELHIFVEYYIVPLKKFGKFVVSSKDPLLTGN